MEDVYSIEEIKRRVAPVAKIHEISGLYLFGSYARGEATAESDVDILADIPGPIGLIRLEGIRQDLEEVTGKTVDIITMRALRESIKLQDAYLNRERELFCERVEREKVVLYEDDRQTGCGAYSALLQAN